MEGGGGNKGDGGPSAGASSPPTQGAGGAAAPAPAEAKPEVKESGELLSVKVKSQDGGEVVFKIKMTTKFEKLMKAYCDRQNKRMDDMVFLFDGTRLRADQTPEDVDMEDGDSIDAMLHQTGGYSAI